MRALQTTAEQAWPLLCIANWMEFSLSLSPSIVPFRRTIQFVLRDKRYGADERDK